MNEAQGIHLTLENGNSDSSMHLLGKLPGERETTRDPKVWVTQAQGGLQLCGCWVPGRVGNPQSHSCHRFSPPLELMFLDERRIWALAQTPWSRAGTSHLSDREGACRLPSHSLPVTLCSGFSAPQLDQPGQADRALATFSL